MPIRLHVPKRGMRRRTKVAIVGIVAVAVVAFVLLAPVFYWFTSYGPPWPTEVYKEYRSLGCILFGFGDTYYSTSHHPQINAPSIGDLVFSCESPPQII
jgi:hypothetical protein